MGTRPGASSSCATSTGRSPRARGTRRPRRSCRSHAAPCVGWRASPPTRPERVSVAILTGRTSADVAARVRVGGITYLGDHGLQTGTFRRGGDPARIQTTFRAGHEASLAPAEVLATRVPEVLGRPPWLFVERKGPSVAFHVRQAEDRAAARAAVEAAIAEVERDSPPHDLAHYRGRLVVDLRPRTAGGKREAFEALLAEPRTGDRRGFRRRQQRRRRVRRPARGAATPAPSTAWPWRVTGPHGMPDEVRAAADVHPRHRRGTSHGRWRRSRGRSSARADAADGGRTIPVRSSRSGAGHGRGDRQPPRRSPPMTTQNPLASPPPRARAGLAHPEDPGDRPDPGQDDRHAGQPLHDHRQVVVDLGQVDVERRRRELAVVVELVGQPDDVVVDVAEVDDLVGVDQLLVAVRQLVEDLADRADRAADLDQLALELEQLLDRVRASPCG